jgi:hypothetical protein
MNNGEELIRFTPGRTLTPVMDITLAKSRLAEFQKFVKEYMVEGEDYGQIPGTQKPTLYKPGADKLCELYGLADSYRILNRLVDFDSGLFDYEIECTLTRDGAIVATGLGCCSSFEGKYRWRDSKRVCPQCSKDTIAKGKEEYGGGWYCNKRAGGCGATFKDGDEAIEGQIIGRMENDDLATIKNTVFKIAKKRSKLDATLSATRSGGQFTQDVGDQYGKKPAAAPVQQPQRKSESSRPVDPSNAHLITDKQLSRLWAIGLKDNANRKALTKDQIEIIIGTFGLQSVKEISMGQYEAVITAIEQGRPPEQREPGQDG